MGQTRGSRDPARLRVVVVANSVLGRAALARLLSDHVEVLAECGTAAGMVDTAATLSPDVVLVEGRLPPSRTDEHIHAAMAVRAQWPAVGVLILGRRIDLRMASRMLAAGTERIGWLNKDRVTSVEQVLDAMATIASGGSVLDPTFVSQLLARRDGGEELGRLTPREAEVLTQMAAGRSNNAIARAMVVSQRAVEKHVASIFDKLGLQVNDDDHRRVLAVLRFTAR